MYNLSKNPLFTDTDNNHGLVMVRRGQTDRRTKRHYQTYLPARQLIKTNCVKVRHPQSFVAGSS